MALVETDLYPPLKSFLEGQGYAVKGEIGRCDVVAVRGDEDPVIVEMKIRFSLSIRYSEMRLLSTPLPVMMPCFLLLKAVASSLKYWMRVPGSGPSNRILALPS